MAEKVGGFMMVSRAGTLAVLLGLAGCPDEAKQGSGSAPAATETAARTAKASASGAATTAPPAPRGLDPLPLTLELILVRKRRATRSVTGADSPVRANLTGTVEPSLKIELPSALIGCKIPDQLTATRTGKLVVAVLPAASVAEQATVVVPSGNRLPEAGLQLTATGPSWLSVALAV